MKNALKLLLVVCFFSAGIAFAGNNYASKENHPLTDTLIPQEPTEPDTTKLPKDTTKIPVPEEENIFL